VNRPPAVVFAFDFGAAFGASIFAGPGAGATAGAVVPLAARARLLLAFSNVQSQSMNHDLLT
jgi:hypothetical protein